MPIYEYACKFCHHEVEMLQRLSDEPVTECPECGQASLKKKISAPVFRLAGGGWYETDFKKSGDKKKNLAGDAASENKAPVKDAKPSAKSDEKSAIAKPAGSSGGSQSKQ